VHEATSEEEKDSEDEEIKPRDKRRKTFLDEP
jgi:hypothetical protein